MISFWEKESLLHYDIIVVGAGIVGLQTAIQIKKRKPQWNVLVLERGLLPSGASTRNAGFAATGSLSELVSDVAHSSHEEIYKLFSQRKQGLDFLRRQLGDAAIGYTPEGSYELLYPSEAGVLEHIDFFNKLLGALNPKGPIFTIQTEKIKTFGFNSTNFAYCVSNATEAGLHTGKLLNSLTELAASEKIAIRTGAEVVAIEEEGQTVCVQVKDPARGSTLTFSAAQVVICTNAFAKRFFPEADVQPGRGQVLITTPMERVPFKGIFHFEQGYYYFRNVGNRVLLGGGRNRDFEGETTTELALHDEIQKHLVHILKTQLLPQTPFEIEMQWSGIMAFGRQKIPIVCSAGERIHGGFRLGGMGVALGSMVALELCERVFR